MDLAIRIFKFFLFAFFSIWTNFLLDLYFFFFHLPFAWVSPKQLTCFTIIQKKLINIYHNHKFSRKCFSDDLFSFSVVNNHCHIILLKINCQSKLVNYFSLLCFVEETVLLKQKSNKSNTRVCFVRYFDFNFLNLTFVARVRAT